MSLCVPLGLSNNRHWLVPGSKCYVNHVWLLLWFSVIVTFVQTSDQKVTLISGAHRMVQVLNMYITQQSATTFKTLTWYWSLHSVRKPWILTLMIMLRTTHIHITTTEANFSNVTKNKKKTIWIWLISISCFGVKKTRMCSVVRKWHCRAQCMWL